MPETPERRPMEPLDQFQSFTQKVFTTIFGIMMVAGVGWAFSAQTEIAILKESRVAIQTSLQEIKVSLAALNSRLDSDIRAREQERRERLEEIASRKSAR